MTPSRQSTWLLTWLILAGLVLGAIVGQLLFDPNFNPGVDDDTLHTHATWLAIFSFFGKSVFVNMLKLMIVPLIISSVIAGVTGVGDFRQLGSIGLKTFIYYLATMILAVTVGLVLVYTIRPGAGMGLGKQTTAQVQADDVADHKAREAYTHRKEKIQEGVDKGLGGVLKNLTEQILPPHANVFQSAVEGRTLALIFFSIFFGIVLTTMGARGQPLIQLFNSLFGAMMVMVHVVIWLAPIGVFCLLGWTVARIGVHVFIEKIGIYMVTVIAGLGVHGLIVLPLILLLFARVNPFAYMNQMRQALMTAFGTDSSSATLPVTMECAVEEGGCSKKSTGFVLPLGATINMDGTALYEAVAVAFLFQAYGIELGIEQALIIALTATLAAVGAAGIPEAGLFTMAIVVVAVNQSLVGTGKQLPFDAIGLIIGVDRILDMCRTTVNVWGDAVGAKIISRYAPDDPPAA